MKGIISYRLTLNSINNYLSNKCAFYNKFRDYNFIPKYCNISSDTIYDIDILTKLSDFNNKKIILKPDTGSISRGIISDG